jgi:hypothetical protein
VSEMRGKTPAVILIDPEVPAQRWRRIPRRRVLGSTPAVDHWCAAEG